MTRAADVVEADLLYEDRGVPLRGFVAVDRARSGRRPGVLIVHQWKGLGDYEKYRARLLARMGYVAFAVDVYGAETRPVSSQEAAQVSSSFRNDRALYRERLLRALEALRRHELVERNQVAAIGYCFGGTGVLELARAGADLDAVVSFHGGLSNPAPDSGARVTAFIQVHHGALDAAVSPEEVTAFWREMTDAGARWDFRAYSGAVHGFTEPGPRHDARADRESWAAMERLFREVFAETAAP